MRYVVAAIFLAVFWIALSGHYTPLLLSLGAVSVVVSIWLVYRMDRVDGEPNRLTPSAGLFGYLAWLLWCVIKSNVDVARRIWSPSLPVRPVWARLETEVETPLEKTLYANSITLTPGTLTTDVRDDHFLVHALNQEDIDELRGGEMQRRIRRLGI
ncbi:MAG: Na+/H+ antiporter subunit E [Gammaproteobacteria bacterium]|nr:Na+/H+ antiporter subunit E [Gammaproteobacteria bacterium]